MSKISKSAYRKLNRSIKEVAKDNADELKTVMPNYYHKGGIDVIGFMGTKVNEGEMRGFFRINILKYVTRFHEKNGVDDLKKARNYLDRLIELESESND